MFIIENIKNREELERELIKNNICYFKCFSFNHLLYFFKFDNKYYTYCKDENLSHFNELNKDEINMILKSWKKDFKYYKRYKYVYVKYILFNIFYNE